MRFDLVAIGTGSVLLVAGGVLAGGGVASATFPGTDDAIAFASTCGNSEAIYSVANGTTNSECPPGNPPGNPAYTQSTSGSIDAMPFFSSDGSTLYFSSDRGFTFGNPVPWSIYSVAYPSTATSPVNTLATPAGRLQRLRADRHSRQQRRLDPRLSPVPGHRLAVHPRRGDALHGRRPHRDPPGDSTGNCPGPAGPISSTDGQANRPEFNPTNPDQLVYVGVNPSTSTNNIYLLTVTTPSSTACTDLSATPTIIPATQTYSANASFADQGPDWSPDGTQIVFDSTRTTGIDGANKLYEIDPGNNTGAYQVWSTDPGEEVEPVLRAGRQPHRGLSSRLLSFGWIGFVVLPADVALGRHRRRGQRPDDHERRQRHDVQHGSARDGGLRHQHQPNLGAFAARLVSTRGTLPRAAVGAGLVC